MSKVPDRRRDQKLNDEDYRRQADFRYAIRRFSAYSERQAHAAGITPQQHLLLLTLRGHPSYPIVTWPPSWGYISTCMRPTAAPWLAALSPV